MNANDQELKLAVDNLRAVHQVLDKYTNKPENYNSIYASYLQSLSWEMYNSANIIERIGVEFYV